MKRKVRRGESKRILQPMRVSSVLHVLILSLFPALFGPAKLLQLRAFLLPEALVPFARPGFPGAFAAGALRNRTLGALEPWRTGPVSDRRGGLRHLCLWLCNSLNTQ